MTGGRRSAFAIPGRRAEPLALGDRSRDLLDALRGWMARNNAAVTAVLFLVIGAKLIGDAISGFA